MRSVSRTTNVVLRFSEPVTGVSGRTIRLRDTVTGHYVTAATACHAQSKRDTRRPSSLPGRGLDRDHGQGGQSAARDVVVFHHGRLGFWRSNRVENAVTITRLPAPDTE